MKEEEEGEKEKSEENLSDHIDAMVAWADWLAGLAKHGTGTGTGTGTARI